MSTHFSESTPRRSAQARLMFVGNPLTPSGYTELNTPCDKLREMRPLVRFEANAPGRRHRGGGGVLFGSGLTWLADFHRKSLKTGDDVQFSSRFRKGWGYPARLRGFEGPGAGLAGALAMGSHFTVPSCGSKRI